MILAAFFIANTVIYKSQNYNETKTSLFFNENDKYLYKNDNKEQKSITINQQNNINILKQPQITQKRN